MNTNANDFSQDISGPSICYPAELQLWLHDIARRQNTTIDIVIIKILTFVKQCDLKDVLRTQYRGPKWDDALWQMNGNIIENLNLSEKLLTRAANVLTDLSSNIRSTKLFIAQIQSHALVVDGQIRRFIPITENEFTDAGRLFYLNSDLEEVSQQDMRRQAFYLKWKAGVDNYREEEFPPQPNLTRIQWLEDRCRSGDTQALLLWTKLSPTVQEWLASYDNPGTIEKVADGT